jgi:hypothetical protein
MSTTAGAEFPSPVGSSGNHLFTASIAADFSSDFDANFGSAANFTKVTADFPAAIEFAALMEPVPPVPIEWTATAHAAVSDAVAPIESVASVLRALMSGSVWSGDFSSDFGPPSGGGAPFEALASTQRAASGDAIAPVEFGLTARGAPPKVIVIENDASLGWDALTPVEAGLTARADAWPPAEAATTARVDPAAVAELGLTARADRR